MEIDYSKKGFFRSNNWNPAPLLPDLRIDPAAQDPFDSEFRWLGQRQAALADGVMGGDFEGRRGVGVVEVILPGKKGRLDNPNQGSGADNA